MSKRKLPDGLRLRGNVYWADFRANGRRVRKSLSRNLKTARQLLTELRARAERGDYGLLDNDYALDDLRRLFLEYCEQTKRPNTVRFYRDRLAQVLPNLPRKVRQITLAQVLAYRKERLAAGVSPGTVNHDMRALNVMLNWAVHPGRLIGENPLKGLNQLPHDNPRNGRALEASEVERLLAYCYPGRRDVWYTFLVTGVRFSELAELTFDDLDWESREVAVQRGIAKNRKSRRIPMDDELYEILRQQQASAERRKPSTVRGPRGDIQRQRFTRDRVFVTKCNTPLGENPSLMGLRRDCRAAGIETKRVDTNGEEVDHVDIHSLRRTFATELITRGADPKSVQDLLGHKTLEMTMNLYTKIHTGTKRQAIGRLSYGKGSTGPDHLVQLPPKAKVGHNLVTTPQEKRGGLLRPKHYGRKPLDSVA